MKIIEKIAANAKDNVKNPAPMIAFLGDSVTQGCFLSTDYDAVYHNKLRMQFNYLFPGAVVNILNAGIGGTVASLGAERIERDVLSKNPDLCVVCFGLNDVGGGDEGLPKYAACLDEIFKKLKENEIEVIFMTPNMLNSSYDEPNTPPQYRDYAQVTMKLQASGMMDKFMETARETARKNDVPVCDCYAIWKKLDESGVDTTRLLINRINHPDKKMHDLFADELIRVMFK